jgi:hypothetical protein
MANTHILVPWKVGSRSSLDQQRFVDKCARKRVPNDEQKILYRPKAVVFCHMCCVVLSVLRVLQVNVQPVVASDAHKKHAHRLLIRR